MGIRDWDIVTSYVDSVTTTLKTVTFPKVQEQVKVKNQGNVNLTYTIGTQTGTLTPGQSVTVKESLSSFAIQAVAGVQSFEVKATEQGTEIVDTDNNLPLDVSVQLNSLTTAVADKASKAELANIGNGSPKGVYTTLSALQTAFPTGTTGIYLVTTDGKWYYWSGSAWTIGGTYQSTGIADKSITPNLLSFVNVLQSQNLFNKNTATSGNLDSGTVFTNANYFVSDFIKIPASNVISIDYKGAVNQQIDLYDSNKTYLAKVAMGTSASTFTYTISNSSAVYIRFSGLQSNVNTTMVVDGAVLPSVYVPYSIKNTLTSDVIVPTTVLDQPIVTANSINDYLTNYLEPSVTSNLFNKYDVNNIDGQLLDNNVQSSNATFFISHYIKIPASKIVTIDFVNTSAIPTVHYYDKDKNYLGKIFDSVAGRTHTFTFADVNAVYFKFNGYRDSDSFTLYKGLMMVVDGNTLPSFYVEYANVLNGGIKTLHNQSYKGKRILFMGDSITAQMSINGWVNWFIKRVVPSSYENVAVAGAWWENYPDTVLDGNPTGSAPSSNTVPNQVQKVLNTNYPAFDVIIISAGTNNVNASLTDVVENSFTSSGNYIDISTLDLTKTASAIRWSVEKLQTAYPNAQIFLCTPIQSHEALRTYVSIKSKGDKIKETASRLGIPYFDNLNCGIYGKYENNGTAGKYLADGLHPNNPGAKMLGEYVARKYISWYCFNA
jgi:lysophospholipase L1-like esterase